MPVSGRGHWLYGVDHINGWSTLFIYIVPVRLAIHNAVPFKMSIEVCKDNGFVFVSVELCDACI